MDRAELSSAIIQEMQAVVADALEGVVPELVTAEPDLATLERRVQHVGRVILGQLIERVVRAHAHLLPWPVRCAACGGALKRRERTRHLVGLVGDYALPRAYYWCTACGQSRAPLDAAVGLGTGTVSPGLARVVARATVDAPFTAAVEHVQEALGATLSAETARRLAERIGTVAEAQAQAAIARAQQGHPAWAGDAIQSAEGTTTLAVEVGGVLVHQAAGWQEMKVGTVAPLGPDLHTDRESGRTHLAWGTASYGVGTEEAEAFWWRVHVEARRRGLGTPAVRRVVVLADGARWIWERARAFLGLPGVEVVEIVDIYHAYGYPRLRLPLGGRPRALRGRERAGGGVGRAPQGRPLSAGRGTCARGARRPAAADGGGRAGHRGGPDPLYTERRAHGLPALCRPALSDWLRGRGECLHVSGGSAAQAGRHALGRSGLSSHRRPTGGAALGALGGLLADAPRPTARRGRATSGLPGHRLHPGSASHRPALTP